MDEPTARSAGWHSRHVDQTSVDAARRELLDYTRCPSCGASLGATRCGRCGLDLAGPDGVRIAAASADAASADAASGPVPGLAGPEAARVDAGERVTALHGSVLAPSTWKQAVAALRERTVRR